MSENTKIAWCDSTINFWEGCTKVSAGCANCYAETRDRHWHNGAHWGPSGIRRKSKSAVKDALKMNRSPWICDNCGRIAIQTNGVLRTGMCVCQGTTKFHRRRIFSLSLGDWLEGPPRNVAKDGTPFGGIPVEWLAEMLDTIRRCPDVEWILCTKRPEQFAKRMAKAGAFMQGNEQYDEAWRWCWDWVADVNDNPPSNITILASVENQEQADIRIPALLRIPAARRGLSLEPLLGPVVLPEQCNPANPGDPSSCCDPSRCFQCGIDWYILGGESGPKARPCNVDWIRSLVRQGKAAGLPVFVKQVGSNCVCTWESGTNHTRFPRTVDPKGADMSEWPADLRVQEFPLDEGGGGS